MCIESHPFVAVIQWRAQLSSPSILVVSSSTTRHDMCLLTQHWNQEWKRKKKDRKKEWLQKFERWHIRYVKDNSWVRSNFCNGNYSCSDGSGKKQYRIFNGHSNQSFLPVFFLLIDIYQKNTNILWCM